MSSEPQSTAVGRRSAPMPPWLPGAVIVLLTLAAYAPVLFTGGFIWDDDSYVTKNALLWEEGGLRRIWWPNDPVRPRSEDADSLRLAPFWFKPETPQYYPVVFTTFWVEYRLWGLSPGGFHLVNVLLHAANAVLIWLVLKRLKVPGAWLIGVVFALHPIHVESVAWITERKNTLSLLFYLCAAMAYLRFDRERFGWSRSDRSNEDDGGDRLAASHPGAAAVWRWYAIAVVLFVLALLSKSVTCSLPAALVLVMVWLRVRLSLKRLALLGPFFVIGFVLAMNTALIERELVGARGPEFDHTFIERTIIASRALLFYVEKHLWPHPLIFIYPRWEIDATAAVQYLPIAFWIVAGGVLVWLFMRGVRGPFVAVSFFAGTVFPALGYFNVYPHIFSFVADHFVYHASIGLLGLLVGGFVFLYQRWLPARNSAEQTEPPPLFWVAGAALIVLFVLTFRQSSIYTSAESVHRDTVAKNPAAWMAHNNLAVILVERAGEARRMGDAARLRTAAEDAIAHAEAAIAARPQNHRAHSNRAEALRLLGRYEEALEGISKAIALVEDSIEPESFHIDYTWQKGRISHHLGQFDQAVESHRSAVARDPDNPTYRHDLAVAYLALERWDEAAEQFEAIHAMNPEHYETIVRLGAIYQRQEKYDHAERFLRLAMEAAPTLGEQFAAAARLIRVLATAPDEEVRNLDEALALATRMAEATRFGDPGVLSVLASVHADRDEFDRAIEIAQQAVTLARRRGIRDVEAMIAEQLQQWQARRESPEP